MFETIDPDKKIEKDSYRKWFPRLENDIRELQQKIREAKIPVFVLIEGFRLAGRTDTIRKLSQSLDPRGFTIHSRKHHTEEEEQHHWLWRYWIRHPERGKMALFEHSWYTRVFDDRVKGELKQSQWSHAYQEINQTEEMLARDGAVIIKLWLHISKKIQKKRLKKGEDDPFFKLSFKSDDWTKLKHYEEYSKAAEEMIERTSMHYAPWIVVESGDKRYRRMKVYQSIIENVVNALNEKERRKTMVRKEEEIEDISVPVLEEMPTVLDKVDLSNSLSEQQYDVRKSQLQVKLRHLQYESIQRGLSQVVVFEGWDAAGKGGTIRRLTAYLDPHFYDVIPISKPTQEELNHHYLWRFWKHIPKAGHMGIYDRSWYGRVLVERIESLCTEEEWQRAYEEINSFEAKLYRSGATIIKFWLHITMEEQLNRFKARETDPNKRWKLTEEDWRNRDKWGVYREAVDEMVKRTSTTFAPWHVIPANCKRSARVQCMETVCDAMKDAIERYDDDNRDKKKKKKVFAEILD